MKKLQMFSNPSKINRESMDEANPKKKRCRRTQAINLSNTLPYDTMLDILSRLPVKPLIRFQSVSNSWKNFVQDPFFIKLHSDHQRKHNKIQEKLIICKQGKLFSLDCSENTLPKVINNPIDHPTLIGWKIWGSCNGLVLIEGTFILGAFTLMYIWNPSTAEIIELPGYSTHKHGDLSFQYSIGYNDNTDDYEVVRIATISHHPPLSEVVVYSLQKKSWRAINNMRYVIVQYKSGVFVKGSLYWIARPKFSLGSTQFEVIAFKVGGGHVREVKLCDELSKNTNVDNLVIVAYKEKLCVLHDRKFGKPYELWVRNDFGMKETWEKKYDILKLGSTTVAEYLVCFKNNGEAILRVGDASFMLYEPHEQSCCEMVGFEAEKEKDRDSATCNEKPGRAVWYAARAQSTVATSVCKYVESLVRLAAN